MTPKRDEQQMIYYIIALLNLKQLLTRMSIALQEIRFHSKQNVRFGESVLCLLFSLEARLSAHTLIKRDRIFPVKAGLAKMLFRVFHPC